MKYTKGIIIIGVLILLLPLHTVAINTKGYWNETAEVNARIDGEIPSIKLTQWTPVNLTVRDEFFLNWSKLSKIRPEWYLKLFWPLNPFLPQPIQRFLGYTSLRFEAEIIEGDSRGWHVKVNPTTIIKTTTGMSHHITLYVQTDDSAINSSIIAAIKCTRIDALGGELGTTYIYVPVKAAPTNFIEMRTTGGTMKYAGLKTIVYFTLDIINEGYYKDVFQFDIDAENGLLGLFNEQAIVIKPGETKRVTLGILTPEKLFDTGTANKVNVYVKSSGNETKTLIGSLTVITQGFYITPLVWIIAGIIIFFLMIITLIYMLYKESKERELYGRPTKPWLIPEEREYLRELKNKDPEKYHKTLRMMKDEYLSALLWYKDYIKSMDLEKLKKEEKTKEERKKEDLEDIEKSEEHVDKKLERKESREKDRVEGNIVEKNPEEKSIAEDLSEEEKSSGGGESILSKLFSRFENKRVGKGHSSKKDEESIGEEKISDVNEETPEESPKSRKRKRLMQKILRQQEKHHRKKL